MLVEMFPSLKENKLIKLINKFFYSYYYLAFIALLTALTCIFGFEMYTYYIYILCGGLIPCLFCDDMTPVFAPLGMAYSSVSLATNNASNHKSLFGDRWHHLYIILALIFLVIFPRFIYELVTKKERRSHKPYLLVGYIFLGFSFTLGGVNSSTFSLRDVTFGLVEFLALSGCYFILLYIIDWRKMKSDYYAHLMMFYGLALVIEVIVSLILTNGKTVRTGWGIGNNIAEQMCMCVCAPLYLAIKKRKSWIYLSAAGTILLGTGLTNSRTGALMGTILCVTGLIFFYIKANKKQRIQSLIVFVLAAILFFGWFFIFFDTSVRIFAGLTGYNSSKSLADLTGRDKIWTLGINTFKEEYRFGGGWYRLRKYRDHNFTFDFVPPRYHNTVIQLLACTGIVGFICYFHHRYQTIKMTFTKPTLEKIFIFLSICGLLLTSIFDCHVFNLGPGLNYCIALSFIEGLNIRDDVKIGKSPLLKLIQNMK